jgi:HEAT repeat protein
MRMKSTMALLGLCGSLALALAPAHAQVPADAKTAKPPAKKAAPAPTLPADTAAKLKSGDDAKIRAALDDVRLAGKAAASVAGDVAALLDAGLTPSLAEAALDTLGDLEVASTGANILPYLNHRQPKVRRAAARALAHTPGPAVVKGLREALSDPDGEVRGHAAVGLGTLRAKDAVPDLFTALEHRVMEAAVSIGQVCGPEECDQFLARLGREPFEIMAGGFDRILFRPTPEVSDETRTKIIDKVRALASPDANKFFLDVQKRWPQTGSAKIKQLIDQAVKATGGDKK